MAKAVRPVSVKVVARLVPATAAVTWTSPDASTVKAVAARPSAPVNALGVPSWPAAGSTVNSTVAPATGLPAASLTWTVRGTGTAWPTVTDCWLPSATSMLAGVWDTVTVALAVTAPAVAVISADPLPWDDTSPVEETLATPASLEVQDTAGELIGAPAWSVTVAVSCRLSPTAWN